MKGICIVSIAFLLSIALPFLLRYVNEMANKKYGIWGLIYRITIIASYLIIGGLFGVLSRRKGDAPKEWTLTVVIGCIMLLMIILDCILYISGIGWLVFRNLVFSICLATGYLLLCGNVFFQRKVLLICFISYFFVLPILDIGIKSIREFGLLWLSAMLSNLSFVIVGIIFALPSNLSITNHKSSFIVFCIAITLFCLIIFKVFVSGSSMPVDTLMVWDILFGYGCVLLIKSNIHMTLSES